MSVSNLSPSEFLCESLHIPVLAAATPVDCHCAMCGAAITRGILCEGQLYAPGTDFTGQSGLGDRTSRYRCAACKTIHGLVDFQATAATGIVTPNGFFAFNKDIERASFFLNPPQDVPFMVQLSTRKRALLWFKTPVNYSHERYQMRIDSNLFSIRHSVLMQAVALQNLVRNAISQHEATTTRKKPKPVKSIIFFDRNGAATSLNFHAHLDAAASASLDEQVKLAPAFFRKLSMGELMALMVINNSGLANGLYPQPQDELETFCRRAALPYRQIQPSRF